MSITAILASHISQAIQEIYEKDYPAEQVQLAETRKDFDGDLTFVCFPLARFKIGAPPQIAETLGKYLVEHVEQVDRYNVVKGFLNLSLSHAHYLDFVKSIDIQQFLRNDRGNGQRFVVEFSSPNTNKPLHLGHMRNNFLGYAICKVLEANGYDVKRVCLVNDRGIAITKSMLMYHKYGMGATPESAGKKPDHFVVDYYVRFAAENSGEANRIHDEQGLSFKDAENKTALMEEAREMLRKWEAGDEETVALWKKMNDWVFAGFESTYSRMGIHFDKTYYESDTYKLGKEVVLEGLEKGVLQRREDGSVFIDLSEDGLDTKTVQRADGTTVYITQDFGTAIERQKEWNMDRGMYVVGDEQEYHFKVLFLILKKLGYEWADNLFHLSYGMVDLPDGRMKTRTGTTVDADNLMDEVKAAAYAETQDSDKLQGFTEEEVDLLSEKIGLAAIKYFLLRVQPKKRMVFDPKESVALAGDTGPFIQYSYARTRSLDRAAVEKGIDFDSLPTSGYEQLHPTEIELIKSLARYPEAIREAADRLDPSAVAVSVYDLARRFNNLWHDCPILKSDVDPAAQRFRLELAKITSKVLEAGLDILGIEVPERM